MIAEAEAEYDVKADKERDTSSAIEDDGGNFSDCFYYTSDEDHDSDCDAEDESSSVEHSEDSVDGMGWTNDHVHCGQHTHKEKSG